MAATIELETPFSPCSFEFQPGTPNADQHKSFRFAGAPDGPLPSIPSGEDDSEPEQEIVLRRPVKNRRFSNASKKKSTTWKDFPFLSFFACLLCTIGGIIFAVAIHKVRERS